MVGWPFLVGTGGPHALVKAAQQAHLLGVMRAKGEHDSMPPSCEQQNMADAMLRGAGFAAE